MSMSRSAIALIASGWTDVFSVPALHASQRSAARARRKPSAIWLRAELWVQRNRTRIVSMITPSRSGSVEESLDDDAVAPLAVELAVAPINSHHPEPAALVQAQARRVLGKDAGDDLPEPPGGVGLTQRLQSNPPRPGAARLARGTGAGRIALE